MNRQPIKSSNVVSGGYDRDTKTLEIEFTTGVYRYAGVPEAVANAFLSADSAGSFVHKQIRPFYAASRVEAVEVKA